MTRDDLIHAMLEADFGSPTLDLWALHILRPELQLDDRGPGRGVFLWDTLATPQQCVAHIGSAPPITSDMNAALDAKEQFTRYVGMTMEIRKDRPRVNWKEAQGMSYRPVRAKTAPLALSVAILQAHEAYGAPRRG